MKAGYLKEIHFSGDFFFLIIARINSREETYFYVSWELNFELFARKMFYRLP